MTAGGGESRLMIPQQQLSSQRFFDMTLMGPTHAHGRLFDSRRLSSMLNRRLESTRQIPHRSRYRSNTLRYSLRLEMQVKPFGMSYRQQRGVYALFFHGLTRRSRTFRLSSQSLVRESQSRFSYQTLGMMPEVTKPSLSR